MKYSVARSVSAAKPTMLKRQPTLCCMRLEKPEPIIVANAVRAPTRPIALPRHRPGTVTATAVTTLMNASR